MIKQVNCEELQKVLHEIQTRKGCTLFDAVVAVAEELDVDVEEFASKFDDSLKTRLRDEAISERMVRQCAIPKTTNTNLGEYF